MRDSLGRFLKGYSGNPETQFKKGIKTSNQGTYTRIKKPRKIENKKEYMKEYRLKNKERLKEQNRIYREKHKEYYKKWYEQNGRKRPDGTITIAPNKRRYSSYEIEKMSIHRVENFGKGKLDTGERVLKHII